MGIVRVIWVFGALGLFLCIALPIQSLAMMFKWPVRTRIPALFHQCVCYLLGVRIHARGEIAAARPLLLLPNHVSWLDISVLSALAPISFVSKNDVARWPIIGTFARLQRSVFVDRTRRTLTGEATREIAERMHTGDAMVLFAEGTSSDGNHVLPYRSALIGAVEQAILRSEPGRNAWVQPMSIAYISVNGLPLGYLGRTFVAWYGDTDLVTSLFPIVKEGAIDVIVTFGDPIEVSESFSRKDIAARAESAVRDMTVAALRTDIRALSKSRPSQSPADAIKEAAFPPGAMTAATESGQTEQSIKA